MTITTTGNATSTPMVVGDTAAGTLTIAGGPAEVRAIVDVGLQAAGVGTLTLLSDASLTITDPGSPANNRLWVGTFGTGTLIAQSGSDVTVNGGELSSLVLGSYAGSSGTATFTGAGTTFTAALTNNGINIGYSGQGVLNVLAGAKAKALLASAGGDAGGAGYINVDGAGSELVLSPDTGGWTSFPDQGGFLQLGFKSGSYGRLGVTAGGLADVRSSANESQTGLILGAEKGSIGAARIDGAGSKLLVRTLGAGTGAYAIIGDDGKGVLEAVNGGEFGFAGTNAVLAVSQGAANFSTVLQSELRIRSGGKVDVAGDGAAVVAGQLFNADGKISISGAGSLLSVSGKKAEILIGDEGTGTLAIDAGGRLSAERLYAGLNLETGLPPGVYTASPGSGTVTVSGAGSAIDLIGAAVYDAAFGSARLAIGVKGNATVTASNGATISIGGARGDLTVGTESLPGFLYKGVLNIESGAVATVDHGARDPVDNIILGIEATGDGKINVTGAGSALVAAGIDNRISIGQAGAGELAVRAGGLVKALNMAVSDGSGSGKLLVSDAGSKVVLSNDTHTGAGAGATLAGAMTVGGGLLSNGDLQVLNGGAVVIRNAADEDNPQLILARENTAQGLATVSGAGSRIDIAQTGASTPGNGGAFMGVGIYGQARMNVRLDGAVAIAGEYGGFVVSRGHDAGVAGSPARVLQSSLSIATGGDVSVSAIGHANGAYAIVGREANSNGLLAVDGAGSTLTVSGDAPGSAGAGTARLVVAQKGLGAANILNGGAVAIDGHDDARASLVVGEQALSQGALTVTGTGSSLNLLSENIDAGGGAAIIVGRHAGSNGLLKVLRGAQAVNDLDSLNSVTAVGLEAGAIGAVTADGGNFLSTLFDGGRLLAVGAGWDGLGAELANVDFAGGGTGTLSSIWKATVRADLIAIGQGGTLSGNAFVEGAVTVGGGGKISPGVSPGILTITGALDVAQGQVLVEANGLARGSQYDQIKVNGAVTLGDADFAIAAGAGFNFADGNRLVLIDGETLAIADLNLIDIAITSEPAGLAWQIADEGGDFVFEALNSGSGAALVSFGAASANAVTATFTGPNGIVSGGRLDQARYTKATGFEGTNAGDTLTVGIATGATLSGMGGNDTLTGGDGIDILDGGAANDIISGGLGNDIYRGGTGHDVYEVLAGDTIAEGLNAGADTVKTALAAYTLTANVEIIRFADTGNHKGKGNDLDNTLYGNNGSDNFYADAGGADAFSGGKGSDAIFYTGVGAVTLDFGTNIHGGAAAGDSFASIENYFGSNTGGDTMTAGAGRAIFAGQGGADTLNGGANIDTLYGGAGDDTMSAGAGVDGLYGGAGADAMTGGAGRDYFVYVETAAAGGFGADTVADWEDGVDLLKIDTPVADAIADFDIAGNGTTSVVLALIGAEASTITLQSATAITITAADFVFY